MYDMNIDHTPDYLFTGIIITIAITLILLYLYFAQPKNTRPVKMFKMLSAVMISIIILLTYSFITYEVNYPSGSYTGLNVSYEPEFISAEYLNISTTALQTITNDTFIFVIEIENSSGINQVITNYEVGVFENGSFGGIYSPRYSDILLNDNFSYQYDFSFYWVINSTNPEVQNLKLLGDENKIDGHFATNGSYINVTFDENYDDLVTTVVIHPDNIKIILPLGGYVLMQNWWVCV